MASKLRTASWVVLTLLGAFVLLVSFVSAWLAYSGGDYQIGGVPVAEVAAGREGVLTALRAIRGTSAAYAAGFAVLFLVIVLGPYRRGEVWSWWALLAGALVISLLILARVPLLGIPFGTGGSGPGFSLTAVIAFGLLLDVKRVIRKG
jgi:hypothetical protein